MGDKTIPDLIDADVSISWSGTDGAVTGNIKHVDDYSELFGESEKEGYFFPFVLDDSFKGKPITVQRKGGEKKTAKDTEWILRLTDNTATEYDISSGKTKIAHLTFSGATLASEAV